MYKTLKSSFNIYNAYSMNSFIYRIRKLPILKNIIPKSIYGKSGFKSFVRSLIFIWKCLKPFITKALYIGIMIFIPMMWAGIEDIDVFINILLILSISGSLMNLQILAPSDKKYYCVNLMKIEAKKYELSHYILFLIKTFVTYIPALTVFMSIIGRKFEISLLFKAILLSILIISIKIIGEAFNLFIYSKKNKVLIDDSKYILSVMFIGGAIAYGLGYLKMTVPFNIILILGIFFIAISIFCIKYLFENKSYKKIYKQVFTLNKIIFNIDEFMAKNKQEAYASSSLNSTLTEDIKVKNGYEYFNSIFFHRHKKILLTSAKRFALVYAIIGAISIGIAIFLPESRTDLRQLVMKYLPYFVFIMYLTNRTSNITQAMFFNCDHSMLTYKFYRKSTTILNIFIGRLKTLISINFIPAGVIAIVLPIILYLSGGTSNILIYFSIFLFIIFLSIFFTVHHLMLYYLLQPYDINMKSKSSLYGVLNTITYIICYLCIKLKMDTEIFATAVIVLTLLYIPLALFLVYKFAPKTFKLK